MTGLRYSFLIVYFPRDGARRWLTRIASNWILRNPHTSSMHVHNMLRSFAIACCLLTLVFVVYHESSILISFVLPRYVHGTYYALCTDEMYMVHIMHWYHAKHVQCTNITNTPQLRYDTVPGVDHRQMRDILVLTVDVVSRPNPVLSPWTRCQRNESTTLVQVD